MTATFDIFPSTIDGIKRKAKSIGRTNKLPHYQALDAAARQSGFEDYHQARKVLQQPEQNVPLLHSIFLSAYWRDTSVKPNSSGLETLEIKLGKPLTSILSKYQCSYARNLQGFFCEYSDHLEMRGNAENQARAKELLTRGALTLQFLEATGLRPVTTKAQRVAMKKAEEIPFSDHISSWVSADTEDWLVLDEPYAHVTHQSKLDVRDAWVKAKGFHWARPNWGGLYYPGQAVPHILTSTPVLLLRIVGVLERLSDNMLKKDDQWVMQSQQYCSQFVSPARQSEGKKRKPRPGTTYGYRKNAVEFQLRPGYPSRLRPAQTMSIDQHKELGGMLKRLHHSPGPYKARVKLQQIQSELEDWMFSEYRHDNLEDVDSDVYYGGSDIKAYAGVAEVVQAIDDMRSILECNYLDSKPLRDLLKKLDFASALWVVNYRLIRCNGRTQDRSTS